MRYVRSGPDHPSCDGNTHWPVVAATTDRREILALKADCALYMPRATGGGPTRAGLSLEELLDDVVALLESGTNIVTTCTDLFARGQRLGDEGRARVLAACQKGISSVYATGSDPGFMTETLPLALLSVQRRVDSHRSYLRTTRTGR